MKILYLNVQDMNTIWKVYEAPETQFDVKMPMWIFLGGKILSSNLSIYILHTVETSETKISIIFIIIS